MSRFTSIRLFALILALSLGAGCATKQQAQRIIDSSNAALEELAEQRRSAGAAEADSLLAASDPGLLRTVDGPAAGEVDEASLWRTIDDIDAFLARHPELTQANNALIVRKAVLLAFADRPNLARAALAAYREDGGNARDRALVENFETLLWWWASSAVDPTSSEIDAARKNLVARIGELTKGLGATPEGTDIHLYLAAVRAHMSWKLATLAEDGDPAPELRRGLEAYCGEFTAAQRAYVRAWAHADFASVEPLPTAAWRMYAQALSILRRYDERLLDSGSPRDWPAACAWLTELAPG